MPYTTNLNDSDLPYLLGFWALIGIAALAAMWRTTVRAVEHSQPCRRIRFAAKGSPEECLGKIERSGEAGLLRARVERNGERTQLVFRILTAGGRKLPLRRYVYEARFEPGAMILEWNEKRSSGHALGQKVLRRYLEEFLG